MNGLQKTGTNIKDINIKFTQNQGVLDEKQR